MPITLYQSQVATAPNASLSYLPGEAHIVFSGPVLSTLSPAEVSWVLAHELSHHALFQAQGGEYHTADQVLHAMAAHPQAEPSQVQSCRFFQLYSEIHADRGAHEVFRDALLGIGALVRLATGLRDADPAAYLAQAEEVLARGDVRAAGLTHPEHFIRARALDLWARAPAAADAEVRRLIEGKLSLDELDLVAQRRTTDLTRRVIRRFAAVLGAPSEPILAHARLFFGDFTPGVEEPPAMSSQATAPSSQATAPAEIDGLDPSVQDYLGYVLLDLAAADRDLEDLPLAAAVVTAREMGIEERFAGIALKELRIKKKALEKLRSGAAEAVRRAGAKP
jgi:hypothetical protein